MKETLFENLEKLKRDIFMINDSDKANGKMILVGVDKIVSQFNKGKYQDGPSELDLDENELNQLRGTVNEIWDCAATKKVDVWPKPDIVIKIG